MKLLIFLVVLFTLNQTAFASQASRYEKFIKKGALNKYADNAPQLRIIKKFKVDPKLAHVNRKKAAHIAIKSEKCDYVLSSDVVGVTHLEYEVICQNGAIIYLTTNDFKNINIDTILPEKEKALPRAVAKSRCQHLINNYAQQKNIKANNLIIERYKITTLTTSLGETLVRIGFKLVDKNRKFLAECSFKYKQQDEFNVKSL